MRIQSNYLILSFLALSAMSATVRKETMPRCTSVDCAGCGVGGRHSRPLDHFGHICCNMSKFEQRRLQPLHSFNIFNYELLFDGDILVLGLPCVLLCAKALQCPLRNALPDFSISRERQSTLSFASFKLEQSSVLIANRNKYTGITCRH